MTETIKIKTQVVRNEEDTAWKDILDAYFKDFIDFCLPDLSKQIDWDKPIISLDKELQVITKGSENGKRLLDKLFKVFLKDGKEQWILIHIEVQGKRDDEFPKRMFTYAYRIWDKYQKPLMSCAILTDDNSEWRPKHYETGFAGSRLRFDFLTIKLLDYQDQEVYLENSDNPFATVIQVQLAALRSKNKSSEQRKNIKFSMTKKLYEKGFPRQKIDNLYKFIDWLIGLPPEIEIEYLNKVYELEEGIKMTYVTSAERFGIEKGKLEGKLEDARAMLAEGCDLKFIARITKLPMDKIVALLNKK